jgi:hypothetical protein
MNSKFRNSILIILSHFLYLIPVVQGQDNSITISNINEQGIRIYGFTLNTAKTVSIEAVGAGGEQEIRRTSNFQVDPQNMFAYAWIINARTRELAWRMTISNTERDWWDKYNRIFKGNVDLEKGEYELYFSSFEPSYYSPEGGFLSFGKIMDKFFHGSSWWVDLAKKWKVSVSGVDNIFEESAVMKYQNAVKNSAILTITNAGNSENLKSGFTLSRPVRIKIYALGEGYKGEMFDYAYIQDANSFQKIWEMKEYETEHAGGAIKNRVIRKELLFAPGDYMVHYVSDDNHSHNDWNANPPYDPNFWGITISGAEEDFDKNAVSRYEEKEGTIVVQMDRLGDYEQVSEGFTVLRPMKLRIYAIGEGSGERMADYGWIEDAKTGRKIWIMDYDDTEDAGGASKNRLYDETVPFEPGSYIVNFVTDDSHSYREWNSSSPRDPEGWGVKIYTIGRTDDENFVKKYNPTAEKNIIVQLVRVGSSEHVKKQFSLKKPTRIRIYAIGEGDWDEMYDYGWIEDFETGSTVWKMKLKETRRAGGAEKNRMYDGTVLLDAGSYVAHYQTDDSHAYGDWNSDPPRDKTGWGMTIFIYSEP